MASTQVATAASPVMFTVVRIMSRMRSTPATSATPSTGRPTDCSTMASMIIPELGTPAVSMGPIPGFYGTGQIIGYEFKWGHALSNALTRGRAAVRHALGLQPDDESDDFTYAYATGSYFAS